MDDEDTAAGAASEELHEPGGPQLLKDRVRTRFGGGRDGRAVPFRFRGPRRELRR